MLETLDVADPGGNRHGTVMSHARHRFHELYPLIGGGPLGDFHFHRR